MYEYTYSLETTARPEAIYQLYHDVQGWPTWDEGIETIEFSGPFVVGARGKIKVPGQPPLDFILTAVRPDQGFTDETPVPGADITVIFDHHLTLLENGRTRITHEVRITGPAAEVVGPQLGPAITADLPDAVAKLAQLAQTAPRS